MPLLEFPIFNLTPGSTPVFSPMLMSTPLLAEIDGTQLIAIAQLCAEAWHGLAGFRGNSSFQTWLLGIAHNHWRNARRKQRTVPVEPQHLDALEPVPSPAPLSDLRHDLERALRLPPTMSRSKPCSSAAPRSRRYPTMVFPRACSAPCPARSDHPRAHGPACSVDSSGSPSPCLRSKPRLPLPPVLLNSVAMRRLRWPRLRRALPL